VRNTWFRFDDLLVDEGNYTLRLANEEMMQGYFDGSDWYDIKQEQKITEEISFIFVNLRDDAIQIKIAKSVSIRNESESRKGVRQEDISKADEEPAC
jgi:phage anti-repressor protein